MKSMNLKLSLFTFLSAIICVIGYTLLYVDLLTLFRDILFLCSYVFFFVWVSQKIYGKVGFSINVIIFVLSLVLAVYFRIYVDYVYYDILTEYCIYAFYLLTITCIISAIVLLGRIIFTPKKSVVQPDDNAIGENNPAQDQQSQTEE